MTDPYDRERIEHDHVVTTTDSGYGAGTVIGAIVVALLVIAALWWLLGGGLTVNNVNDNGGGGSNSNPGGGAVPSVSVPSAPTLPGASDNGGGTGASASP